MDMRQEVIDPKVDNPNTFILYAKTESPDGKPCIGMLYHGVMYILFTVKRAFLAKPIMREMLLDNIDVKPGMALNWLALVDRGTVDMYEDPSEFDVVGIYVRADQYDAVRRTYTR